MRGLALRAETGPILTSALDMRALRQSVLASLPLLTVILCGSVAAVSAATSPPSDGPALSEADAAAIREAAGANNLPELYKTLFAAIAAAPDRVAEVVRDAMTLAPEFQGPIVRTVDSAFPGRLQQPRQAEANEGPAKVQPDAQAENKPEAFALVGRNRRGRGGSDGQQSARYHQP